MSPHKGPNIIKYCIITSTAALVLIAVNTFLISQKSSSNSDTLKMEIKNVSSNLESLKRHIKEISIDLVPSKKQSQSLNKCFRNTVRWIDKNEKDLAGYDKAAKESIAVAVCNGAVYQPTPKLK
tara:strand:- start:1140 stop:1511 length:372 start_codon:yes stop_codon:yes gene_type:complete